ncbi:MAG: hypothetical protein SF052_15175 [Bacteroidia bacterium]|nr:hypothetical protein [Bacteroidia bacterium]
MYYEPDERWELLFGITYREAFQAAYVIKGHFHEGVPEEVREAYRTVEYLLASAWHYWPLYDEGFNKAMRLIEIAVKVKAKALGIDLNQKDNKGKSRPVALVHLIDKICPAPQHVLIKERLNRFRNLRNSEMHPDRHSFMGVMGGLVKNIKSVVNLLNLMFLSDVELMDMHNRIETFKLSLSPFMDQLLVLEFPEKKYLIHSIQSFVVVRDTFFISLEPVMLDAYEAISDHRYLPGLLMIISQPIIDKDSLSGIDIGGNVIRLTINKKEENREAHRVFCEDIAKLDDTALRFYQLQFRDDYYWQIEEAMYAWWGR